MLLKLRPNIEKIMHARYSLTGMLVPLLNNLFDHSSTWQTQKYKIFSKS